MFFSGVWNLNRNFWEILKYFIVKFSHQTNLTQSFLLILWKQNFRLSTKFEINFFVKSKIR